MPPSQSPVPFRTYSVLNIGCLDMMAVLRDNAVDVVFANLSLGLEQKYHSIKVHLKETSRD